MLKTSLTFHNQFQSLHFSRAAEQPRARGRKKSDHLAKGGELNIKHTDSIAGMAGDLETVQMIQSIKPKPQKDSI